MTFHGECRAPGSAFHVRGPSLLPPAELVVAVAADDRADGALGRRRGSRPAHRLPSGTSNALLPGAAAGLRCFGALRPALIGAWTLARNVLVAVAALVARRTRIEAVDGWLGLDAASLGAS